MRVNKIRANQLVPPTGDPGESWSEPLLICSREGEAKFKEDKKEREDVSKELGEPGPGKHRAQM